MMPKSLNFLVTQVIETSIAMQRIVHARFRYNAFMNSNISTIRGVDLYSAQQFATQSSQIDLQIRKIVIKYVIETIWIQMFVNVAPALTKAMERTGNGKVIHTTTAPAVMQAFKCT
jgi:hypothetical protein